MNEPEELGGDVHPIATLLPWFLTGTLQEDERRKVAEHLEECQVCRMELGDLTMLRGQLGTLFSDFPGPSPQLHQAVMERIHAQEDRAKWRSRSFIARLFDAVEVWSRSLYRPRWVPALMILLVVGQLGVLIWFAEQRTSSLQEKSSPDGVISRGVPVPTVRIRMAFQGTAPEDKVRLAIQQLKGHIVDGPSAEGVYIIEVPGADASKVDRELERLRTEPELIRKAERVNP